MRPEQWEIFKKAARLEKLDKVPMDYQRRQTLKNAERFITPELKAFEDKALSAQERALAREKLLYEQVIDALNAQIGPLTQLARALAGLDLLATLAERAATLNWCRPEFVGQPCMEIEAGRQAMMQSTGRSMARHGPQQQVPPPLVLLE